MNFLSTGFLIALIILLSGVCFSLALISKWYYKQYKYLDGWSHKVSTTLNKGSALIGFLRAEYVRAQNKNLALIRKLRDAHYFRDIEKEANEGFLRGLRADLAPLKQFLLDNYKPEDLTWWSQVMLAFDRLGLSSPEPEPEPIPFDPNYAPKGFIAVINETMVKDLPFVTSCSLCYFKDKDCSQLGAMCRRVLRPDKQDGVYFIERDTPNAKEGGEEAPVV